MNLTPISAATAIDGAVGVSKAASIMMLNKSLDSSESMGAAMVQMMEHSVNPNIGANVDIKL